jgi:hypothetical protein
MFDRALPAAIRPSKDLVDLAVQANHATLCSEACYWDGDEPNPADLSEAPSPSRHSALPFQPTIVPWRLVPMIESSQDSTRVPGVVDAALAYVVQNRLGWQAQWRRQVQSRFHAPHQDQTWAQSLARVPDLVKSFRARH